MSMKKVSQNEVFDLVVEYLNTKGFAETAQTLRQESKKKSSAAASSGLSKSGSTLEDLLEKSYVTELASGEFLPRRVTRLHLDAQLLPDRTPVEVEEAVDNEGKYVPKGEPKLSLDTKIISFNPCENDPYGASSMPIYQTATFGQPGASTFGEYDYTRSGNPTRDALQKQVAMMEGVPGAKAFCFTTGMAALAAVVRLVQAGEEIILNDDSYGGTYRLLSKVASRQGIRVKYVNMAGKKGPLNLQQAISPVTRLVMIESPTNPMQRICDIRELARICRANTHPEGTLLSVDNTMMSPILCRPLELEADIVVHSATKFMSGHSDTMAGAVIVRDRKEGSKTLADAVYFYQNAEGTALAPFDCWLVLRGIKTMALRVEKQQQNALAVANWLKTCRQVTTVYFAGMETHPDYDIHSKQSSGGGCVVCFLTGNLALSEHIVTNTKLFKITVSFGSVNSLISLPCNMSHASIPAEVRAARSLPEDLIRMSVGIESAEDLIQDLKIAMDSYVAIPPTNNKLK